MTLYDIMAVYIYHILEEVVWNSRNLVDDQLVNI